MNQPLDSATDDFNVSEYMDDLERCGAEWRASASPRELYWADLETVAMLISLQGPYAARRLETDEDLRPFLHMLLWMDRLYQISRIELSCSLQDALTEALLPNTSGGKSIDVPYLLGGRPQNFITLNPVLTKNQIHIFYA